MSWRIHTGPFPFVIEDRDAELWLWRITDGRHYTAVIVRLAKAATSSPAAAAEVSAAVATRGRSAVVECLSWHEPPREISFLHVSGPASYWGGKR